MKYDADLLLVNGTIYTVDEKFSKAEAMAVANGRIVSVGKTEEITAHFKSSNQINLEGRCIYPGFIDAHCHLLRYAEGLDEVDLSEATSCEDMVNKVLEFYHFNDDRKVIIGKNWDQNKWYSTDFPDKSLLDKRIPDIPALLLRVDIHAAVANQKALDLAMVDEHTKVDGGIFEKKDGKLTGLLIDNAIHHVWGALPQLSAEKMEQLLVKAQADCLAAGLTTISEAWIDKRTIDVIERLQQDGKFKLKMYCMVSPDEESRQHFFTNGPYHSPLLTARGFKFFADGALGSRGAWLLEPYSDDTQNFGLQLLGKEEFKEFCIRAYGHGFQVQTHCIGDAANRFVLDIYGEVLKGKNDRRWRIEHAQIVHPDDIEKFGTYNIIPSVQTTHATSDMNWVGTRVGPERLQTAYVFRELMQQNGMIANGSDFPVESINPILGFYTAVSRKDINGMPAKGFQPENALTREEALKAMTIWAAYTNFEETEKGSLERGKAADFTILDRDIMTIDIQNVPGAKVLATFINGEQVFGDI